MQLTHHWVQRAGAHAAAVLSGRPSPGEVTVADLDALAERIVADAMMAARARRLLPQRTGHAPAAGRLVGCRVAGAAG